MRISFATPTHETSRRQVIQGVGLCASALLAFSPLAACAAQARVYDMRISRNPGCGCCHAWMVSMDRSGQFRPTMTDEPDMLALKRRLGIPADLAACHTAIVEGYIIEGHVPAVDIVRLLETRPAGVLGLAVPGMPLGSPGMEQPGGRQSSFEVVAFRSDGGRTIFARYPGQT